MLPLVIIYALFGVLLNFILIALLGDIDDCGKKELSLLILVPYITAVFVLFGFFMTLIEIFLYKDKD